MLPVCGIELSKNGGSIAVVCSFSEWGINILLSPFIHTKFM